MEIRTVGFILFCVLGSAQVHSSTIRDDLIHGEGSKQEDAIPEEVPRVHRANFDQRARDWVWDLERYTGHKVKWHDLYLKQQHLIERPQYHQYHIDAHFDNFKWGKTLTDSVRPGFTYTQWYHNGGSQPIDSKFSKATEISDQFTWSVTSGIKIGVSTSISVGLPAELGVTFTMSSEFEMSSTSSQSQTKTETYSIENNLVIPPMTSVKAEFIVSERELTIPYESDVIIEGYIAVWFDKKWNGHWLWFFPIVHLKNHEFQCNRGCSALQYGYTGTFRGVLGLDHYLQVTEYPLQHHMQKTNSTVPVGEPVTSYQIRPPISLLSKFPPTAGET